MKRKILKSVLKRVKRGEYERTAGPEFAAAAGVLGLGAAGVGKVIHSSVKGHKRMMDKLEKTARKQRREDAYNRDAANRKKHWKHFKRGKM